MINEHTTELVACVLSFIYLMTKAMLNFKLENKKLNIKREIARRSKNVK